MRNAQGQWVLERSFIPPLLSLSASPLLLSELSDLLHRLAARRKRLMAMRRESNERMAGMFMAPDQVNDTWRITLTRDDLDPDKARVIEVSNNRLTLKPLEGE